MAKKKNVKSKIIAGIVLGVLACAAIAGGILYYNHTKTVFNDNPTANGNTAGNLYNKGLYAEADGIVYFSNPLDHGYLYAMNSDETKATRLSVEMVYSLNAYGKYIYYARNNLSNKDSTSMFKGFLLGAARCNLKGGQVVYLNDRYTGNMALVGNTIYLQDFESKQDTNSTTFTIKSIGIDGQNEDTLTKQMINIAGTTRSTIYYSGTDQDHNIYALNTKTKSSSVIAEGNFWMPIVVGNELYYIDLSNNYALVKTTVNNPENKTVLTDGPVSTYNVSSTYIYFQMDDGDNSKLCRIRKDASTNEYEVVREGHYENINITSKYVYFNTLDQISATYRTPVNGPVSVQSLSNVLTFDTKEK